MASDTTRVLMRFAELVEQLSISYVVGGSLASGAHGEPRTTRDVDVLVELLPERIDPLVAALAPEFYVDRESVREAVERRRSFNVVHLGLYQKIDVFVAGDGLLDREQLARKIAARPEPDVKPVFVTSAEVIVLRKLDWYRRGGGVSDQQWRDVLGVLKVQGGRLDLRYLRELAHELELAELLDRASIEAGVSL